MNDSTNEFETLLNKWENYPEGYKVLPEDEAELIVAAQTAQAAPGWMWPRFAELLTEHGNFKNEKAAQREVKRCRIKADLGCVPANTRDFISVWLKANGYVMDFAGGFTHQGRTSGHDRDYLGKSMKLWSDEMKEFSTMAIDNAFDVWMVDQRETIQREATYHLRFDPKEDPGQTELAKFVRMIVAPGSTPQETDEIYRAAEVSLANFIYRTKNHMRGVMKNSCHMMPILQGRQGDGKSEAIKALCGPIGAMAASTSFDAFGDNSMTYQFSIMPVMIFEEMAGAGKADIEKLKTIMTETQKQMREAYARAGTRRIISTFIASSNKDVSGMIKDDSGNRRLIQFSTKAVGRKEIHQIDYKKIWRSVDEDAVEPPKYANASDLAAIESMQEDQRFRSPVEDWIENGDAYKIPWGIPSKALKLWESFEQYLTDAERGQVNYWSARRLGVTLAELAQAGRFTVKITRTGGSPSFAIERPAHVVPVPMAQVSSQVISIRR